MFLLIVRPVVVFFFQAEDGIRDWSVTGVQTCALPISIAEFRKATEAAPNLPEAFLDLGEVYAETGNYAAAIAPLKRALELNPELDGAHLQLGYALLAQGYAGEAIPHLERVRALEALGVAQIEN